MLKLLLISTLFLSVTLNAQVNINVNVGTQPKWAPAEHARYYYLPDVEAYYDVNTAMFIYYGHGTWLRRSYLPYRYAHYDLYKGHKVTMRNYHGNKPYIYHSTYKIKYAKGKHNKPYKANGHNSNKIKGNSEKHPGTIHNNKKPGNSNHKGNKGKGGKKK